MAIYKFITDSEIKDFNDTERSFVAWASKASIDRQGEEIDPSGWLLKNYRKNPVVPLFHDYMRFPIAKSLWEKVSPKDNPIGLLFKPQFAETEIGQEAFYLYKEGFMSAFSVGFDPLEWIDGDGRSYAKAVDGEFGIWQKDYIQKKNKKPRCRYTKQELLEISGVLVPAHPEALIEARGIVKTKELAEYLDSLIITSKDIEEITLKIWDDTSTSIRHRIREPELFVEGSFRTVPIKRDKPRVNSVMGKLKTGNGSMIIQSVIFPKEDGWTMEKAKAWFKDHPDLGKEYNDLEVRIMELESVVDELKTYQYTGYYEQEDEDIEIETPEEVEVDLDGDLDIDLELIEVEL